MAAIFALLLLAGFLIPAGLAEIAVQEIWNPDPTSKDADQKILELTEETQLKFADVNQAMHGLIARMERLEQMMNQHLDHHSSTHDSQSHSHDSHPSQHDSHHIHQDDWDHSSHHHDHSSHHDDHTYHDHQHDHSSHNDDHTSHQDDHTTHQEDQQEDLTPHQHIHHHSSDFHSAETTSHEDNHPHANVPTFHFDPKKTDDFTPESSDHHSEENDHDSPAIITPTPAVEPPFTRSRAWQTGLGDNGPRSRSQGQSDPHLEERNFIHGAEGNTSVWMNTTQSFNTTVRGRSGNRIFHHRETHHHSSSHGRRPSNSPVRHATYFKHGNHFHLIANVNFDSNDYLWGTCDMKPNRALPPELQQNVTGRINLWQHKTDGFLHLHLNLTGFARGRSHLHGFHVHEVPNMTHGCEMVGEHFNPHGQMHGSPESTERHVGDFGNIKCDHSGNLNGYLLDNLASLRFGRNNIVGLPLVIHANADDMGVNKNNMLSTSYGNAGPKIACCIVAAESSLSDDIEN